MTQTPIYDRVSADLGWDPDTDLGPAFDLQAFLAAHAGPQQVLHALVKPTKAPAKKATARKRPAKKKPVTS